MSLNDNVHSPRDIENPLQGALLLMPRSMNPWIEFEKRAIVLLDHKSPAAFSPLLIVASCLLAIATILYGAGLIVRWRKGTLWFFRVVRVGNESFVLPHYVCTYSGLMICFSICLQSFLWVAWVRHVKHIDTKHHFLADSLPWLPGVLGVCLAVWSLTTTWVLHIRAYRTESRPWYTSAKFVNSIGIVLPAFVLATLLPTGIIASGNLQAGTRASKQLYTLFEAEAATWTPAAVIDPAQLRRTSILVYDVAHKMLSFQYMYEIFFSILAGWCGALGLAFVTIASLYLRDLRSSIREMQGRTRTGVETFARTFRWLVLVTIGLGTSMIALAANVSWIAATLKKILSDGTTSAISIITPLQVLDYQSFTVAVLGVPVSITILHNALTTPSARSHSVSTRSNSSLSIFGSKLRSGRDNVDQTYTTQFHLVAGLPTDKFAFLASQPDAQGQLEGERALQAVPFDSLELQPTPTTRSGGGNKLEGIIVHRHEETVTVVALPQEKDIAADLARWDQFDIDEKKW
ncbi:hypothetical protein JCM16303_005165 [Sporobolomyces ruberrimus]